MHRAAGRQHIGQPRAVAAAVAVDEDDDVGAQVALVVEHVAAQRRVEPEGVVERGAQRRRRAATSGVAVKRRSCGVNTMRGMARMIRRRLRASTVAHPQRPARPHTMAGDNALHP